jgi:hypothetical protein
MVAIRSTLPAIELLAALCSLMAWAISLTISTTLLVLVRILLNGIACFTGMVNALVNLTHGVFDPINGILSILLHGLDHTSDFLGGAGGTFGKFAHLFSNHGKTPALFTGACRFNCRI